jgi:hypothetical protein
MQYLFIFTAGIVILNLLKIATLFGKNTLSLPSYKWLSPTQWWVFYPSFFFQVYWWSVYVGLVNGL